MLPKPGNTSRTYPIEIRRSRCASGIVTRIGLLATCFNEAYSSLVSRLSCRDKDRVWRRFGIYSSNMDRAPFLLYVAATIIVLLFFSIELT
jgi:hypothetical protein